MATTKPPWQPGHPIQDGVFWLSVAPKNREPSHWEEPPLPHAWLVRIKDGHCEAVTPGMKSYSITEVPPCDGIMKHVELGQTIPEDPWATQNRPIVIGDLFAKNSKRVKVVGFKGKTTVMVVAGHHPISSRPEPARGMRSDTLLRDWTRMEA